MVHLEVNLKVYLEISRKFACSIKLNLVGECSQDQLDDSIRLFSVVYLRVYFVFHLETSLAVNVDVYTECTYECTVNMLGVYNQLQLKVDLREYSEKYSRRYISNNPCFSQEHTGVPDSSDASDRTSYPLKENYTVPIAQGKGRIACLRSVHCVRDVVTYTHHQNDMCGTLFAAAPVMMWPCTQCLVMFMPFSGQVTHYISPLLQFIGCHTLPIYA